MFHVGDAVVHPAHGVGTITEIKRLRSLGGGKQYYAIRLLGESGTTVMVSLKSAQEVGLRSPMTTTELGQVWRVLCDKPIVLPSAHEERYEVLRAKLHGGDVLQVAEAVRDITWRREEKGQLTLEGKRLFDKGMSLLAAEIASVLASDLQSAEFEISRKLRESMA